MSPTASELLAELASVLTRLAAAGVAQTVTVEVNAVKATATIGGAAMVIVQPATPADGAPARLTLRQRILELLRREPEPHKQNWFARRLNHTYDSYFRQQFGRLLTEGYVERDPHQAGWRPGPRLTQRNGTHS